VKFLLDTNAVIALLKNNPPSVRKRFRKAVAQRSTIGVSSVVLFELWYGVARSVHQRENAERLQAFMSGDINMVSFGEEDAALAGELRATLERAGTPIGAYDLLIAAQAIRTAATLVTANASEFGRVRGLSSQNWSASRR
jgi:tRNA(fMet)-specific endonuclease VapC